jgi:hypothetical protein
MRALYLILLVLPLVLALQGCVTSRPVALPNGRQGYAVNCPGARRDIGDCMNEAARACGGGPYQIVTQTGEMVGSAAFANQYGNSASGVSVHAMHRTMIVECGAAETPPAAAR